MSAVGRAVGVRQTGGMSDELERSVTGWAERRPDIRALALVGSRARTDVPADAWSDYDFVVVVEDDAPFLRGDAWTAELAPVLVSFIEDAAAGGLRERRVLFADGVDADFTFVPLARLGAVLGSTDVAAVFARGHRVLYGAAVLGELPATAPPVADDYAGLVHEFWYRAVWTARKLRRGEVHVAAHGCNCGLRVLVRRALELEARAGGRDVWHQGRFFERWAEPVRREAMAGTVASDDAASTARAIRAACELFSDICSVIDARRGEAVRIDTPGIRRHVDAALDGSV